MASAEHVTYCRLCEPMCGLIATVEDGRLAQLRPDHDNPLSRGAVCPKGIAFTEVQNDPKRLLTPVGRGVDGELRPVSWDAALTDIGQRLRAIHDEYGGEAIALYAGNPVAFSYSAALWMGALVASFEMTNQFSAASQDTSSRHLASEWLYGAVTQTPFPDLPRTDFLLMIGANPLVSHGGLLRAPRIRDDLADIVARGGRVVVIDPRRTETARHYEHIQVRPDADAWLLLSMLQVIFTEGLTHEAALQEQTTGVDALRTAVTAFPPEATASVTGLDPERVRQLARDFATAPHAATYGRTGACLGRHATLVNYLIDALAIVTGNLDRPGGVLFAHDVIPVQEMALKSGRLGNDTLRTRVSDLPAVMGTVPASMMAEEILTPGKGKIRALLCIAGDPVISTPDGGALAKALGDLDLLVSIDLYANTTSSTADYVLPSTTFLERDDWPFGFAGATPYPFAQMSEPVVEPYGETRQEWQIFEGIIRRAGFAPFVPGSRRRATKVANALAHRGIGKLTPRGMITSLLRLGPYGDRFGLRRGGLNAKVLMAHRHGLSLAEFAPTGRLAEVVRHEGGKVRLDPPRLDEAIARLHQSDNPDYPLRMIGIREMRSLNSWLFNSPTLMKGDRRPRARISPHDAAPLGLSNGHRVRISSATASLELEALVTDEVGPGTIAIPHGWAEANSNLLTSSEVSDVEPFAGMSHLNGVPVRLERVP